MQCHVLRVNGHFTILLSVFFILFYILLGLHPVSCEAQKVRVGYVKNYGMITKLGEFENEGFGYDYLTEIAKYTGWEYEFVPCGWSEGLQMLQEGKIDIFGPLQKTPERQLIYDFPRWEMGYEYGALYALKDKNAYYNDIASLNGCKIGTEPNNSFIQPMNEFCQANGISVEYVYANLASFEQGLQSGAFDAVLLGSISDLPNTNVIAKTSMQPYYYATTKGNAKILDGLNASIEKILLNDAYFAAKLDQKYYGDESINHPSFTRQESEYISQGPTLRVVGDPDWSPIEFYDNNAKQEKGINIDILKEISRISGITFQYIPTKSYRQSVDMFKSGEADLLIGRTEYTSAERLQFTDSYLKIPLLLIGRKSDSESTATEVALPIQNSVLTKRLMESYPNFTYREYADMRSAFEAFRTEKASYLFINAYEFNDKAREFEVPEYMTLPTDFHIHLNIGVSRALDPVVLQILNKAIKRLTPEQISTIVFANTVDRTYSVTMSKFTRSHTLFASIFLAFIFLLVFAFIFHNNKLVRKRLERSAYMDETTGLPTLLKFKRDAVSILKSAHPSEYMIVSVDIDNFKYVNDSFGYQIGNQVLCKIADHCKAKIVPGQSASARVGADNFVLLVKSLSQKSLMEKFEKWQRLASEISALLSEHYQIIFSIGVYVLEDPTEDINTMLDKAHLARKSRKNMYRHTVSEYTAKMNEELDWERYITLHMENALLRNEFVVYLQPKYSLREEKIVGAEALVRWNHPEKGLLPPGKFVPIFEKNGFIQKLDIFIFREVCGLLRHWKESSLSTLPISVSVNLSRLHLSNLHLVDKLASLTQQYGIPAKQIEIELTESMFFASMEILVEFMTRLKTAGFQISIDDFGSGYSSLNLLKDLPADVLKIDKVFLEENADTHKGQMILLNIVKMARSINLTTVAEGVETAEQADMLKSFGCDIAQGYYYAKPIPVKEFEALVKS